MQQRVCTPAGMHATAFLRLDELPGSAAIGYLPRRGWRSNHLHVPVRGAGDGGAYSTAGDVARLWTALFAGRIVPPTFVQEMLRPQLDKLDSGPAARRYGLGFWLSSSHGAVQLEGSDAGISFRSSFEPTTGLLYSVLSNTTSGAWSILIVAATIPVYLRLGSEFMPALWEGTILDMPSAVEPGMSVAEAQKALQIQDEIRRSTSCGRGASYPLSWNGSACQSR